MTGLERLRVLIDWFKDDKNVSPWEVDLSTWQRHNGCRTVGCVVGWAASRCDELQNEGLGLAQSHTGGWVPVFRDNVGGWDGWDAVCRFFELGDLIDTYWRRYDAPLSSTYRPYAEYRAQTNTRHFPKWLIVQELEKFYEQRKQAAQMELMSKTNEQSPAD